MITLSEVRLRGALDALSLARETYGESSPAEHYAAARLSQLLDELACVRRSAFDTPNLLDCELLSGYRPKYAREIFTETA